MKLPVPSSGRSRGVRTARAAAFTLAELLLTLAVFSLLMGGILCANLFGLRMMQVSRAKLSATDQARKTVGKMTDEIRNCKSAWVGTVTNGVFTGHLDGELQTGGGLLIRPTTNAADFIVYYINPADRTFRRTTSQAGTTTVLARSVTNAVIFRAQDYLGTILTNNQNQRVIHVCLECFEPGSQPPASDYYKLETSVARRTD